MNWKIIEEFPRYEISDEGICRRFDTKRVLKASLSGNRYYIVELSGEGTHKLRMIHRLVALAFIPNPENRPYVNHKDFNPSNNRVANLEWVTPKGNYDHSSAAGRYVATKRRSHARFTDADIIKIRYEWTNKIKRVCELAREHNVKSATISMIVYGRRYAKVFQE